MLQAKLNKSWKQPKKQHLYNQLPPISKTTKARRKKTCGKQLEKQGWTHKWPSSTEPYTATYLQSQKLLKVDEKDVWGTAWAVRVNS